MNGDVGRRRIGHLGQTPQTNANWWTSNAKKKAKKIIPKGDEGELVAIFADGTEWQIPAINARAHRGMRIVKGLIIMKVVRLRLTRRSNDQQRREVMHSLCA